MYIRGVQCDSCKKIYNTDNIHIDAIPGWISVNRHKQSVLHFCSTQCLSQWVRGEQKVETIENMPFRLDGESANVLAGYMKEKGWDVEFKVMKDLNGKQWEQFQAVRDDGRKIHIDSNFFRGMTMEQIFRYIDEYIDKYVRS